ncbi:hypothetical protein QJS04_geneDACA018112 [Acorus gramineus]|uniref:Neprosin PEP catalytic domain-containing protein n=1 Tax=Acorus gramineus TaxID=55184 RepID=A0AAV9AP26_ACOGR|nr:hypothetical protein QJS04_geneDACA018112 [Acorus gramineus]
MVLLLLMALTFVDGRILSKKPNMKEIDRMLKVLNKPAIKTIKSADGDIIDCVDIHKQPAFDHPLLRNHTIQVQTWHLNGTCPEGTIPIRRIQKSDLIRAASLKNFGRKSPWGLMGGRRPNDNSVNEGHEHAIVIAKEKFYMGALASLNVWKPQLGYANDFSLSQVWLSTNNAESTIEVGWIVNPDLYGDNLTRIFTYWTADGSHTTGCYNLKCSGFVQVNSDIALGATATPISVYDGPQYQMTVSIFKEQDTGNWWLQVQGNPLGYWPSSLVPGIANGAERLQYGGEIFDKGQTLGDGGQHTTTEMGSGHFPDEGEKKASVFTNIQVVDLAQYAYISPKQVKPFVMRPGCYDVSVKRSDNWGLYFFYGGPGRNPKCP